MDKDIKRIILKALDHSIRDCQACFDDPRLVGYENKIKTEIYEYGKAKEYIENEE